MLDKKEPLGKSLPSEIIVYIESKKRSAKKKYYKSKNKV